MIRTIEIPCGSASVRPNHDQHNNYGVTATLYLDDSRLENLYFELKELYDDPTPWCHTCYAATKSQCSCGNIVENN